MEKLRLALMSRFSTSGQQSATGSSYSTSSISQAPPTQEASGQIQPNELNTAREALYSFDKSEDLKRRLELRDVFRDQQLFQSLLPRSESPLQRWTKESAIKTWVDHWCPGSDFTAMDTSRIVFSSALSGLFVSAIATPFDVVKNYWIYSPHLRGVRTNLKTREVVRSLYRHGGGLRAFYTGFGATCCTIVPANLIFFAFYEQMRYQEPPATAGIKARAFAVVLTAPCEYVRTRLQANAGELTTRQLLRTITAFEGVRAFSRGILVTLFRDSPFSAIYWTLNEKGKTWLTENDSKYHERSPLRTKFLYPFISAGVSAAIASTMTQPLDVIKTNIQGVDAVFKRRGVYYRRYSGVLGVSKEIYKGQGLKGFYVGLLPRLAKVIPSCAVLLATYDFSKAIFTSPDKFDDLRSF